MAGLIGVGRNTLGQASVGFQQSAALEANRNAAQQQLNAARAAQRSSMVSSMPANSPAAMRLQYSTSNSA